LRGAETEAAIEAANVAFPEWKRQTAEVRADLLMRWHDLMPRQIGDLALINDGS